ncbi:MAG: response regulator transcription factor [Nonlabens sp.]
MNILLADHHPLFRKGLKCIMSKHKDFHFEGNVSDGSDLIQAIKNYEADIVILEIDLPNANGVGSLREIRANFPEIKTLVVSCHSEEIYAMSSIKAGANGYISKTRSVKEVRKALISVSNGGTYLHDDIQSRLNDSSHSNNILKFKKLSTREIEVLNLLSRGKRNKDIAQSLTINEKTVSTYKTRLLKKLNVDNIADLIHQSRLMQINGN